MACHSDRCRRRHRAPPRRRLHDPDRLARSRRHHLLGQHHARPRRGAAGGHTGIGYTYADRPTAQLIHDELVGSRPRPRRLRQCRRPGPRWSTRSATRPAGHRVDGHLRRRRRLVGPQGTLLDLPLVPLLGAAHEDGPRLRQRRLHLLLASSSCKSSSPAGSRRHPAREDEDRHAPRRRPRPRARGPRGHRARLPSCSSTPTGPTAASRRWPSPSVSPTGRDLVRGAGFRRTTSTACT